MKSNPMKHVFPILVLVLSLITVLYYRNFERNYISLGVSLMGILGVILFYFKSKIYHICFNIWIIAQFLLVYVTSSPTNFDLDAHPLFNAVQSIFFKYSFTLFTYELAPKQILHLEFNFIPILFYFLYYNTLVSEDDAEN